MPYIKSYSNYVVNKEHQLTNDGKIYERDITTIGGLDNFSKGQIPIYRSGNFIITINNEPSTVKEYSNTSWEKNPNGDDSWSLENISEEIGNNKIEILSNQEYYDLRDFAYYGSCSELIRGSLTDIINRFPGELYAPTVSNETGGSTGIIVTDIDGKPYDTECKYLLDNPFGINLHTEYVDMNEVEDPLKYFCNGGFENYEFFSNESNEAVDAEWEVTKTYTCDDYKETNDENKNKKTFKIADIKINSETVNVKAVKTDNGEIVYLTNSFGWRVRPKKEFQDKFFKSLDSFQKVLLNRESKPKYSALFQIIRENRFGYYTEMKSFTFPTTYGDYNLAVNDSAYSEYLNSLVNVSILYDEYFSDNLYRAMTHEAIKNFDWSYTREYPNGNEGEYFIAGTRIQNTLRLFGREFDEIKRYIDGIGNSSVLSYNSENNMPNFLLSDILENDGWDVTSIIPFKTSNEKYVRYNDLVISPYQYNFNESINCFQNGYFLDENCERKPFNSENKKLYVVVNDSLRPIFKQYFSDKEYTMQDVENHFMKVLRLNSRHIWRHKGSIEGIEMVLALFGMKSKRFVDSMNYGKRFFAPCEETTPTDKEYDYEITEYVSFTEPINDTKSGNTKTIDEYNQTKTLVYNTDDYRNGVYNKYQGLPVRYYEILNDEGEVEKVELVPYFDKDMIIDGNSYYQMKGGWLYEEKDSTARSGNSENYVYTETLKNIPFVDNLKSLLSIPYKDLSNGNIYYVNDLSTNYVIIDGVPYEIFVEKDNNTDKEYFEVSVSNHSVKIGGDLLIEEIIVSSAYKHEGETYNLDDLEDGYKIKIYLLGADKHCFAQESFLQDEPINLETVLFYNKQIFVPASSQSLDDNKLTNYFKIEDKNLKNDLKNGWKQLSTDDEEYKQINKIKNYFKGNNPHSGNNQYDSGEEYLDYFRKLFKHAIEKEAFDVRCYPTKTMDEIIEAVNDIGFDLTGFSSDKIVFLGDIRDENFLSTHIDKITLDNTQKNITYSEQIINTKKIKITFNCQDDLKKKYINEVVLKYLSGMIPSTAIVQLEFKKFS